MDHFQLSILHSWFTQSTRGESSHEYSKTINVAEELEDLRKKVRQLERHVGSSKNTQARGCPFYVQMINEPLHDHFKSAKIRDYDGSIDPEEHLARFENVVMLHCYKDKIKCKAFLTTLVDSAQRWLDRLESQSITSFENFRDIFLHHFSSSNYKKTSFGMFEIKQTIDEPLRAYIRRFNRASLEVPSCASETKVTVFTQELRNSDFFDHW